MQQHPGALQMLQKADAQTRALRGTFDEAGNVGHHKAAMLPHIDDPEIRDQRREGVVRHLRPGRGNSANQRGFARVWQPQQADVRDHLHLKRESTLLAGKPRAILPRRTIGAGFEALIAPATLAALGHQERFVRLDHVGEDLARLGVAYRRTDRDGDVKILPSPAGAIVAAAGIAVLAAESAFDAEVGQGVDARYGAQINAAAVAPVTAVRASQGHEFLATKTGAAPATVAGLDLHFGFVDEFHDLQTKTPARAGVVDLLAVD